MNSRISTWFYPYCHRSLKISFVDHQFLTRPKTNLYSQTIICKSVMDSSFWATQEKVCMEVPVWLFVPQELPVLDDPGKTAFHNHLNKGGVFVAFHSASDYLRTTSFYGREMGELSGHFSPTSQSNFEQEPTLITTQNCKMLYVFFHRSTSRLICLNYRCRRPQPSEHCRASNWMEGDGWNASGLCSLFYQCPEQMLDLISKSDPRSVGAIVVLVANESSYFGKRRLSTSISSHIGKDDGIRKFDQGTPHPIGMWVSKYQWARSFTR